eukprot:CAMPEP_0178406378 /NCGR_PEP_ID=MMETSP0689_2-20121128/18882_1 /TAXON_ID=160604 /ORGANISM="Amphidinium massartii, Strain CS-259" /LENGTH=143 /DNA_ID=CAMNT_0020027419 /DNA_START=156 /DNA_END=587 /DNA_ORIENTATION=+
MPMNSMRGLSVSPVRATLTPPTPMDATSIEEAPASNRYSTAGALMAGSPLFLTDMNPAFMWSEIQFVLSGPLNGLFEGFFETEAGPLFLNGVAICTLLRMAVYYGFLQPSYLLHFQERYGQTWTVGHHLYGCDLPNPLKKAAK